MHRMNHAPLPRPHGCAITRLRHRGQVGWSLARHVFDPPPSVSSQPRGTSEAERTQNASSNPSRTPGNDPFCQPCVFSVFFFVLLIFLFMSFHVFFLLLLFLPTNISESAFLCADCLPITSSSTSTLMLRTITQATFQFLYTCELGTGIFDLPIMMFVDVESHDVVKYESIPRTYANFLIS